MKRSFLLIASLLLSFSIAPSSSGAPATQYSGVSIFGNVGAGFSQIGQYQSSIGIQNGSSRVPTEDNCNYIVPNPVQFFECSQSKAVSLLKKYSKFSSYVTGLPLCSESTDLPCLNSINFSDESGKPISIKKIGEISEKSSWLAAPEVNLQASHPVRTLWTAEIDGAEKNFLMTAKAVNRIEIPELVPGQKSVSAFSQTQSILVDLIPYSTPALTDFPLWVTPPHSAYIASPIQIKGRACPITSVWYDEKTCAVREEFPQNFKVSISIKSKPGYVGSSSGRIFKPDIKVVSSQKTNLIEISGSPIVVPGAYIADLSKAARFLQINGSSVSSSIQRYVDNLRTFTGDTASDSRSEWNMGISNQLRLDVPASQVKRTFACLPSVTNSQTTTPTFLTTNALMGQSTPPKYDGKDLIFKLTGFHRNSDNSVFMGYYQVIMDSKLARCIYNLKDKALQAKVSITDVDGQVQKAFTQTLKEDSKTGKIYFEVANFHFSDPIIKVQLTN